MVDWYRFRGFQGVRAESQSKEIRELLTPSHTCISWYGWTREESTWDHAPMSSQERHISIKDIALYM